MTSRSKLLCAGVVLSLILSGVGGVATAAAAPQTTQISSCTTISSPGQYVLTSDIWNSRASTCITIAADDVTLDGQGHTVDGVQSADSTADWSNSLPTGIRVDGASNVVVENVVVSQWEAGVEYHSAADGRVADVTARKNSQFGVELDGTTNTLVENVTTVDNGVDVGPQTKALVAGIALFSSDDNAVRNSVTRRNSRHGVIIADDSDGNSVESIVSTRNGGDGLTVRRSSANNTVVTSRFVDNGQIAWDGDGIEFTQFSSNNVVWNNLIEGSRSDGVSVNNDLRSPYRDGSSSGADGNRVVDNELVDNARGVHLYNANRTRVIGNRIADSRKHGIRVWQGSNNRLILNAVRGNDRGGVVLSKTDGNALWSNRLVGNDASGVAFHDARDNRVGNTTLARNGEYGANLTDSDGNRLESNRIRDNGLGGVEVTSSDDNRILTSEVRSNDGDGVDVLDSAGNVVGRNTFVDNRGVSVFVHGDSSDNALRDNDDGNETHTLRVRGSGSWSAYEFGVSGAVTGGDRLEGSDSTRRTSASGGIVGGTDVYRFTGSLESLRAAEGATVFVDGDRVDPAEYDPSELLVEGTGEWSSYRLTTDGRVTDGFRLEGSDSTRRTSASGGTSVGVDGYRVAGGYTELVVNGDATARLDGRPLHASRHTVRVEGSGSGSQYRLTVDGEFVGGTGLNGDDSYDATAASGGVYGGSDVYTFVGDLSDVEVDGDATVYVDGDPVSTA